ncbi:MAG: RsiV family protein [Bacteroidales bacterium]|nr:RsiV family protein [Bacteroidales bacterium]
MKRTYIFLILCILSIPYFTSCKQKTIKTVEKNVSQKYYLSSDTTKGKINIDINVEIPVCYDNKIVLDSIRKEIISNLFGDNYINISIDLVVQKFAADLITEYKLNNAPLLEQLDSTSLYTFNNEHVLEGFSLLNDERIYSYGINRYVFMGGAHGLSNVNYFNFDLRTGKKITEKELFKDDYATKLSELIKVRIVEQSIEDQDSDTILNLEDTDFWVDAIKPNGNFYITDESINYIFNPYEIAPYYMGQTEVIIPFYRLKDILKPNNVISYLTDKEINK